ncbi:MAG: DUF2520 domain-containing protein [Balneolaceae bacterium]|nr:DUF2520 domain-containing protein [Balneolaceae bacterium]
MNSFPNVSIIGTGALGGALAKSFAEKGISVYSLFNRSKASLEILAKEISPSHFNTFPKSSDQLGKLVFITVNDDQIEDVAHKLSALNDSYQDYFFVHCSGNKSSDVLQLLSERGASVASFHPLQTITTHSVPDIFEGIYFDIQGDQEAVSILGAMAEKLGAQWFEISADAKPYLHAAAVMSSNYLISLLKASADIAEMGEIDSGLARKALMPLVEHTLENAAGNELSDVLTGPIARGDIKTVEEHVKRLEPNSALLALYKKLGIQALELADLDEETTVKLMSLLKK